MATAKKAAPAKVSKKSVGQAATTEDDLLAAKPAKATKAKVKPAAADDLLAAKPAKASKAKAEAGADDLLAAKPAKAGKAKAAPAKKAGKAKPAAAAAEADDLLAAKPAKKAKAAPAADKPKPKSRANVADDGTTGTREEVKTVLLKTRKATTFAEIAEANNFNVRMVRRTARGLKAEGLVEIGRDGTSGTVVRIVQKA